jgi:hypothetical protein
MVHLDPLIDVAVLFLRDFLGTSHCISFGIRSLIISYPLFIPTRWGFYWVTLRVCDLVPFDLTQ